MGGNSIAWRSCKQNATATSSAESEVQAMQLTAVLGETIRLLMEPILQSINCVELVCDNPATITYASGEGTWKTKNLINEVQFIRKMVSNMEFVVSYVPTKDQVADIFTKLLEKGMHQKKLRTTGCLNTLRLLKN